MTEHDPSPDPPETTWLDDEHTLEPVDPRDPDPDFEPAPVVRDARGRLWKVRRRPRWFISPLAVLCVLVVLVVLVLAAFG